MIKVDVKNTDNEVVGTYEIADGLILDQPHEAALYDTIKMQLANRRAGTHATKNRKKMTSRSGEKPWRQKGTGRARAGTRKSPLWRGGAVAFGPQPRDYSYKVPKKIRKLALKSAISTKFIEKKITFLDELNLEEYKTKAAKNILNKLDVNGKTLIVSDINTDKIKKATNNIQDVKVLKTIGVNPYDVLKFDNFIITLEAWKMIEKRLVI